MKTIYHLALLFALVISAQTGSADISTEADLPIDERLLYYKIEAEYYKGAVKELEANRHASKEQTVNRLIAHSIRVRIKFEETRRADYFKKSSLEPSQLREVDLMIDDLRIRLKKFEDTTADIPEKQPNQ